MRTLGTCCSWDVDRTTRLPLAFGPVRLLALLGSIGLAGGCNALTGLDDDFRARGDAVGASGSGTADGSGGATSSSDGGASSTMASSSTGATTTCPAGLAGEGSEASPCLVTSCEDLRAMGLAPAHYRLANDIDCIGAKTWNAGAGFKPVEGVLGFDGAGHTILNLFIDRPTTSGVGLFASTTSMKSGLRGPLRLTDVDVTGQDDVGALAGELWRSGDGPVDQDVVVTGVVRGRERVGGVAGKVTGVNLTFVKLWFKGEVYGDTIVGGLVGQGAPVSLAESGARGTVAATGYEAGGLVGRGSSATKLANTMFIGTVEALGFAGGLVGRGAKWIDTSYAVVKLLLPAAGSGAGLAWGMETPSKITRSFAVARVVTDPVGASANVGGLANTSGLNGMALKFADSYWVDFASDPVVECFVEWDSTGGPPEGCNAVPASQVMRFYDKDRSPRLSWTFDEKSWSSACGPDEGYPTLAFLAKTPFAHGCVKDPPP